MVERGADGTAPSVGTPMQRRRTADHRLNVKGQWSVLTERQKIWSTMVASLHLTDLVFIDPV